KEKEAFSKDTYDLLREIFKYLVQKNKFLELNTRTISIYGEPNPDIEILNLYKSCGGEMVTLGSDAHNTDNIGMGIKEAIEILKDIGYKYIMIFDGTWKFEKI
ncbi:MAG: histidinol phosphate phosphatase, partial [Pseudothermotoga sp.]